MLDVYAYTFLSVLIVSLISFVGVLTLGINVHKLSKILLYLVSFSAGALFGDAFFHLLPEATEETGFTFQIGLSVIIGIVLFFVLEKIIHWRHCHHPTTKQHVHPFAIMNLIGDAVHNFIDGLIIAASYLVSIPVGIATTIAVILHEIPQEIGDFGVMLHGGFTKAKALLFNFLTALFALLGAGLALILSGTIENLANYLVPFAAGGFLYIAGSDLLPELHKESNVYKSIIQLITFLLGVGVMILLLQLE